MPKVITVIDTKSENRKVCLDALDQARSRVISGEAISIHIVARGPIDGSAWTHSTWDTTVEEEIGWLELWKHDLIEQMQNR